MFGQLEVAHDPAMLSKRGLPSPQHALKVRLHGATGQVDVSGARLHLLVHVRERTHYLTFQGQLVFVFQLLTHQGWFLLGVWLNS